MFYKKDGLWVLKGYEDYPLYQRRIINLLASNLKSFLLERVIAIATTKQTKITIKYSIFIQSPI